MPTAMTQKGQVTIPKHVRDAMGAGPGTLVEVVSDGNGGARVVKFQPKGADRSGGFARFRGIAKDPDGLTTDEIMALIRDEIDA